MQSFIHISQGRFGYLSWGEPADTLLLCLHGFPDTPHSFALFAQEMVTKGYYVVAPFLRGYAPSPLGGSFAMEQLVLDVYEMAEALAPGKKVFLLGHDWGAAIAYVVLSEHPEKFSRAVTLSVPHPVAFLQSWLNTPRQLKRSWYMFFFQTGPLADMLIKRNNFALIEELWGKWSPGYRATSSQWMILKDCLAKSWPYPVEYYRNMFWPPVVAIERLRSAKKISTPVLYLHGAEDGCIGYEARKGQERFFTDGLREVLIERVGHFIPLEAPERMAREVLAFAGG